MCANLPVSAMADDFEQYLALCGPLPDARFWDYRPLTLFRLGSLIRYAEWAHVRSRWGSTPHRTAIREVLWPAWQQLKHQVDLPFPTQTFIEGWVRLDCSGNPDDRWALEQNALLSAFYDYGSVEPNGPDSSWGEAMVAEHIQSGGVVRSQLHAVFDGDDRRWFELGFACAKLLAPDHDHVVARSPTEEELRYCPDYERCAKIALLPYCGWLGESTDAADRDGLPQIVSLLTRLHCPIPAWCQSIPGHQVFYGWVDRLDCFRELIVSVLSRVCSPSSSPSPPPSLVASSVLSPPPSLVAGGVPIPESPVLTGDCAATTTSPARGSRRFTDVTRAEIETRVSAYLKTVTGGATDAERNAHIDAVTIKDAASAASCSVGYLSKKCKVWRVFEAARKKRRALSSSPSPQSKERPLTPRQLAVIPDRSAPDPAAEADRADLLAQLDEGSRAQIENSPPEKQDELLKLIVDQRRDATADTRRRAARS